MKIPHGQSTSPAVSVLGSTSLPVSISGDLTSIKWSRGDKILTGQEKRINIRDTHTIPPPPGTEVQSTLMLRGALPQDSGDYTVTATNDAGSHSKTFKVNVKCKYNNTFMQNLPILCYNFQAWHMYAYHS